MEYFEVKFNSLNLFNQMKIGNNEHQEVTLLCQEDEYNNKGKEIIFSLPTPEGYNDEDAQFSIGKEEAELMIKLFKFHFGI